jgi:DNA-binding NtrC family response regulator
MKKEVVVLDANQTQSQNICDMLEAQNYKTASLNSLSDLNGYMEDNASPAVILNLDNITVTNTILRQLKAKNPLTNIIAVSERQFHPELEESLREYISVCLTEPVDPDELNYWLKAVFEDNKSQNG